MFEKIVITAVIVLMGLFIEKCWVHICDENLESMYVFGGVLSAVLLFFSYVNVYDSHLPIIVMFLTILFTPVLGIALYSKFNARLVCGIDILVTFMAVCLRGNYTQTNLQTFNFIAALALFGTILYANCFLEQRADSKSEIIKKYENQQEYLKNINNNLIQENNKLKSELSVLNERIIDLQETIDSIELKTIDTSVPCCKHSIDVECNEIVNYYTKKILKILNSDIVTKINSEAKSLITSETKLIIIVLNIFNGEITLNAYNNEHVYVSYSSGFTEIGYITLKDDFKLSVDYFESKRNDLGERLRKVVRINLVSIFKRRIDERYNKEYYRIKRVKTQQY